MLSKMIWIRQLPAYLQFSLTNRLRGYGLLHCSDGHPDIWDDLSHQLDTLFILAVEVFETGDKDGYERGGHVGGDQEVLDQAVKLFSAMGDATIRW